MLLVLLTASLGCRTQAPEPVPRPDPGPIWEAVDLRLGDTAHFTRVDAAVRLERMRTALVEHGHLADGGFALTWDDGTTEAYDGPLPLVGCSRGFVFVLDGMGGRGSVSVEGPDQPCPPAR